MSGVDVIHQSVFKARRKYWNDGAADFAEWIGYGCSCDYQRMRADKKGYEWVRRRPTFAEYRVIVKIRQENYEINKGTLYRRQFNRYEGDTYVWRTREDMYQLMCKYDLFPEV